MCTNWATFFVNVTCPYNQRRSHSNEPHYGPSKRFMALIQVVPPWNPQMGSLIWRSFRSFIQDEVSSHPEFLSFDSRLNEVLPLLESSFCHWNKTCEGNKQTFLRSRKGGLELMFCGVEDTIVSLYEPFLIPPPP